MCVCSCIWGGGGGVNRAMGYAIVDVLVNTAFYLFQGADSKYSLFWFQLKSLNEVK